MWHILIRALNLALCQLRQAYMCPHSLFSNDASRKEIKDTVTDCNAPNPCYNLQQPMKKVYSWSTPRNMTPPEGSSHPLRNYSSPTHRIDMTGSAKVTRFDDMSFTGSFTNLALNFQAVLDSPVSFRLLFLKTGTWSHFSIVSKPRGVRPPPTDHL